MLTLEWGPEGVRTFADASVLIIVDVLSFSTAVDIATSQGAEVIPFGEKDSDAQVAMAEKLGATLALPRRHANGRPSLSPGSLYQLTKGQRLLLPSPNGSRLSELANDPVVLAGCLRNAATVSEKAVNLARGGSIAVIPAGETWPGGGLRPAIEDWLGAGMIAAGINMARTPEAELAVQSFKASRTRIAEALCNCTSGLELREMGFGEDVMLAAEMNCSTTVPQLIDGRHQAT